MSFIIGNKCVGVCDTSCVEVCPVDCINGPLSVTGRGEEVEKMIEEEKKGLQLYIDPTECINCEYHVYQNVLLRIYTWMKKRSIAEGDLESGR